MSTFLPVTVTCPRCAGTFEGEVPIGLNAERMPALRHALLDDRFQRFTCVHCLHPVRVEPSLVYADFERRQWFAALPRGAFTHRSALAARVEQQFDHHMRVACAPMVRAWADDFTVRLVFGTEALREKLVAADAGLDDRLIEALKWDVARREGLVSPTASMWLRGVDDTTLHLRHIDAPDATEAAVLAVDRRRYAAIEADRAKWAAALPTLWGGIVVDWRAPLWPDEPLAAEADAWLPEPQH